MASPSPNNLTTAQTAHDVSMQRPDPSIRRTLSNLDEGYSEDTRSQSDASMTTTVGGDTVQSAPHTDNQRIMAEILRLSKLLPHEDVASIVFRMGASLPVAHIATLEDRLKNLCYFDPVQYLPNELLLDIFSRLEPKELLRAARVSREWHVRTQDQRLWRLCFAREGWKLDTDKVRAFETMAKGVRDAQYGSKEGTETAGLELSRSTSKKRRIGEAFEDVEAVGAGQAVREGDSMVGVESAESPTKRRTSTEEWNAGNIINQSPIQIQPLPFQHDLDHPRLSWPYLYKQRRRLEKNWDENKYVPFRLPHPGFPQEGHQECVYTIQHSAKYLVSGSRDKTIRVWDMDTCRLAKPPLVGHEASVLCLQFDERPEHDIIVSGGSDSWVIIWKFSTGEIIKKMTTAHDESVLNLRFDDRYIVTCSKDKKIKLWNRRELARDSPLIPIPAIAHFNVEADIGSPIPEFSLLYRFESHQAAVNAVMIYEDIIVSASGDRTIKSWNLRNGKMVKNYPGHTKGIACVQYDGRRIVSGSSDNTVRIFDAEKVAEVACLHGHSNLVRTVQARFGDLETTTVDELQMEADKATARFQAAARGGMTPASASRRAPRNAGSSRPEDMLAVNTRIPPGGGGNKWARIVSGSYDETVIIWKRDADGKWLPKHKLHQEQLSRRTNRIAGPQPPQPGSHFLSANIPARPAVQDASTAAHAAANHELNIRTQLHHQIDITQRATGMQHDPNSSSNWAQVAAVAAAHQHLNGQIAAHAQPQPPPPQPHHHHHPGHHHHHHPGHHHHVPVPPLQAQPHAQPQPQAQGPPNAPNPNSAAANTPVAPPTAAPAPNAAPANPPAAAANPQLPHLNPHAHAHPPAQGGVVGNQMRESNRVFKLQFDARRIVCCSQNRVIVGWDFAAGERELELIGGWSVETA